MRGNDIYMVLKALRLRMILSGDHLDCITGWGMGHSKTRKLGTLENYHTVKKRWTFADWNNYQTSLDKLNGVHWF